MPMLLSIVSGDVEKSGMNEKTIEITTIQTEGGKPLVVFDPPLIIKEGQLLKVAVGEDSEWIVEVTNADAS